MAQRMLRLQEYTSVEMKFSCLMPLFCVEIELKSHFFMCKSAVEGHFVLLLCRKDRRPARRLTEAHFSTLASIRDPRG